VRRHGERLGAVFPRAFFYIRRTGRERNANPFLSGRALQRSHDDEVFRVSPGFSRKTAKDTAQIFRDMRNTAVIIATIRIEIEE
jgi:hypothetical protein